MSEEHYVAYHGFVYLKGAMHCHRSGMTFQLVLDHEEDYKVFKEFRKHRKGKAGTGLYSMLVRGGQDKNWTAPEEVRFLRWTISSANGAVVTFETKDPAMWVNLISTRALDAGYTLDQLEKTEVMFIELDQEGKPINVEQRAKLERMAARKKWPKGGPQSKRAARLCQDREFQEFVRQHHNLGGGDLPGAAELANWMRALCDIDTRAQLDHDTAALQRFEDRVMKPFLRSQV